MQITKLSAAELTMDELAAAMNATYQGYVMPVHVGSDWMTNHVESNDVRLDASLVWRAGDAVVALALVGLRGERSWLGAFGITPEWRGKRLTGPLLDATLAAATAAGARRMQLEVISTNTPAIRVYERGGFVVTRELGVYQRDPVAAYDDGSPDIAPADPASILANREQLGGTPLAWQREAAATGSAGGLDALVNPAEGPLGYTVWRTGSHAVQIVDVGGVDSAAIAATLRAVGRHCAGQPMTLLNEPLDGTATEALRATGWREVVRQLEMTRPLSG